MRQRKGSAKILAIFLDFFMLTNVIHDKSYAIIHDAMLNLFNGSLLLEAAIKQLFALHSSPYIRCLHKTLV